jgi:ATP-binding cassette subfamily B protein
VRKNFRLLPRIWPHTRPFRGSLAVSAGIMLLAVVLGLAAPWPLAFLVDSVLGRRPAPPLLDAVIGQSRTGMLIIAVVAGVVLTLLSGLLDLLDEYLTTRTAQRMTLRYRSQLFEHTLQMSPAYHDGRRRGTLMFTINHHAACIGDITSTLLPLTRNALMVIGMIVVAAKLAPVLALLAMTVLPLLYHSTGWYGRKIEPRIRGVRDMEGESLSIVYEAMSMVRVIISFGRERHEHGRFVRQGSQAVEARIGLSVRQTMFSLVINVTAALGTALVLGYGAHLVLVNKLTVGELLVVLTYVAAVYKPLTAISGTLADLQQQLISLEAALQLEDAVPDVVDQRDARDAGRLSGAVAFESVDFDHLGRTGTLRDISFSVVPGDVVALVGPTGAGKSTLVNLLPRFMEPAAGRVLVDGIDVRDLTLASLRSQISVVLQEPLLFSGTIAENIRYGDLDADDDQVYEAARSAGCHDFIAALPDGYGTILGERGAQLSGGERQRIAIARAFLRDAPLLILDEPTSAVDSRTEAGILTALDQLMVSRTTFLIAHRLSTIRSATKVLVIDGGRLVESGTAAELLEQDGLFRELVDAQAARPTAIVETGPAEASPAEAGQLVEVELPVVPAPAPAPAPASAQVPAQVPVPFSVPADAAPPVPARPVGRPAIVLLGMLTKMPVAGVAWQTLHYLAGFERLGYDAYYVEMHGRTPSMLMATPGDDPTALAGAYLSRLFGRFGFTDRWAYVPGPGTDGGIGMPATELRQLLREAALVINLHGGTEPSEELAASGRLVYLETDPCQLQVELEAGLQTTHDFLAPHVAFFTFAERYGLPGCELPVAAGYDFRPTRQPVVLDFWSGAASAPAASGGAFTTIGNWQQSWRDVRLGGTTYSWSKHLEFAKVLGLPGRVPAGEFELALSSLPPEGRALLLGSGWQVGDALGISRELDPYRVFIQGSRAEFTVAKDQNVRLKSGWFSDRSASYLAAGRPVVTQDTGFDVALPLGAGLHAFSDLDGAVTAIERVLADPAGEAQAAAALGREYFGSDAVLGQLLADVGLPRRLGRGSAVPSPSPLPGGLDLRPVSRRPLQLADATVEVARQQALPMPPRGVDGGETYEVSVVVVTYNQLPITRLMLATLLGDPASARIQVIISDNGSTDGTAALVRRIAARDARVTLAGSPDNDGFAAGVNRGVAAAVAPVVVIANNDLVLSPGALPRLAAHVADPTVGAVGPATNRSGVGADLGENYRTWGEFVQAAQQRALEHAGDTTEVGVLAFFCVALRREVLDSIGPLDERFGAGMFEDDDYAQRLRAAGLRLVVAEDVLVHHHGEATIGALVPTGEHARLFADNRAAFEAKWGVDWMPQQRTSAAAEQEAASVVESVRDRLAGDARVLVVSRGDDALLAASTGAGHFPQGPDGAHPGHHPGEDDVVPSLSALTAAGWTHLLLPASSAWWLERYAALTAHLDATAQLVVDEPACRVYRLCASVPALASAASGPAPGVAAAGDSS